MAAISRVHALINDPEFAKLPMERREALIAEFEAEDAAPPAPERTTMQTVGDVASRAGGTAMDLVRGVNEGFYGSIPGGRAGLEAVSPGGTTPQTSPFAHRVGQDVGAAAGFALPVGAAAKSAQAITRAAELAGQTPALALQVLDYMGKSMVGIGAGAPRTALSSLIREARIAVQSGVGAATAQVVAPDSKVAEIAGQLIGALGIEGAVNALRWGARQVMGGPVVGAFTEVAARQRVGKALHEAIPEGSAAEAGLSRAAATQEATGLKAPVAQATGSPGMAAMERDIQARYPDIAARAQTQRAATSEALRERVQATPGAGGTVPQAQGAVETSLARQRAAAEAPVAAAEAGVIDARRRFTEAAASVDAQMTAAIADAERQATTLAGQLRPADLADPRVLGDRMRTEIIEPARRQMKGMVDTLFAEVDPGNTVRLPVEGVEQAIQRAVEESRRQLIPVPTEVKRLAGELARLRKAGETGAAFNDARRWNSALGDAIDAATTGADPNRRVGRILTQLKDAVGETLDQTAQHAPDVAERYTAAKQTFAQYAQRFLDGVTAKVMARGSDAEGGFKVASEDVSSLFFRSTGKQRQQAIGDWFDAAGGGPEAQRTIRDAALKSFFERAFRTGTLDATAASQWQRDHAAQLRELAARGVDLRPELTDLTRRGATVEGLEQIATQARKRLASGVLPQAGPSIGAAEQHAQLARASADRTVREIDRSAAQAFVGADPDRAVSTLLRGDAPAQRVREVMTAAAHDPAALRGIRQGFLNDALKAAKTDAATATGNPTFDAAAFSKWLDEHKGAVAEAFGAQGAMFLREQAAIARQVVGGPPVGGAAAMREAVAPEALYSFGQLFGRIYSTAKGFVGKTFLVSELFARKVSSVLGGFSNEELKAVYELALTDPQAARTLRMLAMPSFPAPVVERRMRAHLANLGGRIAGAPPSDQP